jgi:hypothetical protein
MIVREALGHITPHSQLFCPSAALARHVAASFCETVPFEEAGLPRKLLGPLFGNAVSGPEGSSVGIIDAEQKQNRVHAGTKMGDNAFENSEW